MTHTFAPDLMEIHRASKQLDDASPAEIMQWAGDRFGDDLVVTASFGDATLVHLAATTIPGVEIALIDTGYLFAETLWYAERLRSQFDLNLTIVRPQVDESDADRWQYDPDGCCGVRKVEPLNRTLQGRAAWASGLRRADSAARANAPAVSFDVERGITKINPLVSMTDDDVEEYHRLHDLPKNPLTDRGYPSIGCWPCTRPVQPGDDPRAGRWADTEKTECGLHL
jgi:phosphoadenosine phosphosulfate reductase